MDEQYCKNIHYKRVQHKRSKQKGRKCLFQRNKSDELPYTMDAKEKKKVRVAIFITM